MTSVACSSTCSGMVSPSAWGLGYGAVGRSRPVRYQYM